MQVKLNKKLSYDLKLPLIANI